MAAIPVGGSTAPTPNTHTTDPKAATAPKRPTGEDGKAAKTAPGETTTAVQNTFGKVPGGSKQPDSNAKQPGNGQKAPLDSPKAGADTPKAPADSPKAGGDAPKDAGAARQPAAPQPDQPATTPPANDAKQPAGTDPKLPVAGQDIPKSSIFYGANDPKRSPGDYAKTADGKDYAKTADGKFYIQYNEKNNAVAVDDKNNVVQDPFGRAYALNNKGEFAVTADGKNYIVYDKSVGGNAVAVQFQEDRLVTTPIGHPKVVAPDGTYAKNIDGKEMIYIKESGGKIAVMDGTSYFTGPGRKVYLVNPDGKYAVTVDGKYMAFDPVPDSRYVAISEGRISTDPKGRTYSLNADGTYMQPEPGKFAVVNKYDKMIASDGATGEVVKDASGHAYVLDNDGKYMQPEAGKFAVYNEQTGKTIATDGKGNPVTDASGNPHLVGDDGKYVKTEDGNYAVYTPKLSVKDLTLYRNEKQEEMVTADGLSLYQDKTGKFVGVSNSSVVVEIDPVSGKMVTDADGKPILLSDPYADRPLGTENMNRVDLLHRMPIGVEDGDPMVIKGQLFKDGVLDNDLLYAALAKYDVRDVYDALINSSKYGGWDKAPAPRFPTDKYIHPDPATARMLIGGLIAWNNDNGPYAPLKAGELPFLGIVDSPKPIGGNVSDAKDVNMNLGPNGIKDLFVGQGTVYHEMNHTRVSDAFIKAMDEGWNFDAYETVTEYLANQWTGDWFDTGYDGWPGMIDLGIIMRDLGGGDHQAGVDILKRAYFHGDPVAIQLLLGELKKHGLRK